MTGLNTCCYCFSVHKIIIQLIVIRRITLCIGQLTRNTITQSLFKYLIQLLVFTRMCKKEWHQQHNIQVIVKLCNSIRNFRLKTVIHSIAFLVHNNNPHRCTSFVALGTWLHLYGDNVLTAKEQTKTNNNSRHPLIRNWSQRELCPSSGTKIYGCICSPRTRHRSGIVNHENVTMCVQGSQSVVEEHTPKRPPPHSS